MHSSTPEPVSIVVVGERRVSGLFQAPISARACYVMAHGAGAGMEHPFMAAVAHGLAGRNIATLRFQFPYMEQGSKRPDSPGLAQLTVRSAVSAASRLAPGMPLFVGGKSFGGRMSSQSQAESPLPGVHGLVFLGFPLHPAGKPSDQRAQHLFGLKIPMLFLQGTRDALADLKLLQGVTDNLGSRATLRLFKDADHSFHVPARSGRTDSEVRDEIPHVLANWIEDVVRAAGSRSSQEARVNAETSSL